MAPPLHLSEPDDARDADDSSSDYSSVSEDSLPPIHAYGHTYHGSARLYIPHDAEEDRRLRIQHELYHLVLDGRLHDARLPIEDPTFGRSGDEDDDEDDEQIPRYHILDVGSGNGLWAVEAAQRYPKADVLGIDLTSALLPKDVPANLTFEIADVAEPWPPTLYDFIHIRNLVGGGVRDWERLVEQALQHLKPGGILEFTELRPRFYDVVPALADLPEGQKPEVGLACLEYHKIFHAACQAENLDFDPVPRVEEYLQASDAEMVRERVDWLPVSGWGRDPLMRKKGELLNELIEVGLDTWSMLLLGKNGMGEEEIRTLLRRILEETQDPRLRSCFNLTFITAKKPLDDATVEDD
ncbi:S-adenosyl-L-methionine-dependent methyltransferase [Emericellopsis atlantica]|uniref:S-adenosyl-L-methionine-dependent methyltransferase n=1 Tax=Emericellopsis atlantica TaxID=2614577 RepID=A0A9P7ZIQ3_9HYPO|nr:S-adenosyl-L-methionine-dependent methyltransferase [Emericellopsis atlantica]KAG9252452.1 S-adenosyl-L-methionine-dependent methyltransferase [Emericellopsis atlantica]